MDISLWRTLIVGPKVSILERFDSNGRQKATLGVRPIVVAECYNSILSFLFSQWYLVLFFWFHRVSTDHQSHLAELLYTLPFCLHLLRISMIRFQMVDFQEIEGLPILRTLLNLKCETLVWPLHILHFILQMIPWAVDRLSGFMEILFQQSHLLLALKTP